MGALSVQLSTLVLFFLTGIVSAENIAKWKTVGYAHSDGKIRLRS